MSTAFGIAEIVLDSPTDCETWVHASVPTIRNVSFAVFLLSNTIVSAVHSILTYCGKPAEAQKVY